MFRNYHQNQDLLLPPSLKDCLPEDHLCFVINDIVNGLDLSSVENTYKDEGSPAYNPRLLTKILFYAYSQGIRSSRKIENSLSENNAMRFLSGNSHIDHGTINLFRKNHLANIPAVFAQIVVCTGNLGMADLTDISIDGTKIKASASKKNLFTQEAIDKIESKMKEILSEAELIDQKEDKALGNKRGYNQIPEKLINPQTRKKEIEKIQKKLAKLNRAKDEIKEKQDKSKGKEQRNQTRNKTSNTTDPDANPMKMKDGSFKMAFNCQLSASNQIITAYDVTNDPADTHHLQDMVKKSEENTKQKVKTAKADSSYFTEEDIEFTKENNINALIPDVLYEKERKKKQKDNLNPYSKDNFIYDKDKDEFTCPEDKALKFKRHLTTGSDEYTCTDCTNCLKKSLCTKAKNRTVTLNPKLLILWQEMRTKLETKEGKDKYQERMSEIEPVIGNIKCNQNLTSFLCRGKTMVEIELGLASTVHNITKIFHKLKREGADSKDIKWNNIMVPIMA
jgi:transposase